VRYFFFTLFAAVLGSGCAAPGVTENHPVSEIPSSTPEATPPAPEAAMSSPEVAVSSPEAAAPAPVVEEPFLSPLAGKTRIVSGFGSRTVPGKTVTESHEGLDLAAAPGTAVRASRSGMVLFAGSSKMYVSRANKKEQSRMVIIRHADGMSTRYVHLGLLKVTPKQEVVAGDVLAPSADSDEWSVPVVHFEIREANGKAVDPRKRLTDLKK
jgi:murein DD-endopeptidase MepM/ murein hydrolase activator NlpD